MGNVNLLNNTVVGLDGIVPIYNPDGLWKIWARGELWTGAEGRNRYVPKVNDWVTDPTTREWWIVDHLDPVTWIPSLRPFSMQTSVGNFTEQDIMTGRGPGRPSELFRLYVNSEVKPSSAQVDAGCYIYGTLSSYAKVFKGTDTDEVTGLVISKMFDAGGSFVSTSVPLELAALDSHTNYATKVIRRFWVTDELADNEIVTVVLYSDDGHVTYKRQLLVDNTDTIISETSSLRYIEDISIESLWLNNTAAHQIDYPLNIPLNSLNMMGVIHYSSGEKQRTPIGSNGRFAMLGLDTYLPDIPGSPMDLTLRYVLGNNEVAISSHGTNNRFITKPYRLVTTNPNYGIEVKLFVYPHWLSEAAGYQLRWHLLNADRDIYYDVTEHVRFSENTGPYDPKLFGYLQRKTVSLNLRDVSKAWPSFNHVQMVDIVLNDSPSNDDITPWTVLSESNDSLPRFGENVVGRIVGQKVNFSAGHATLESWLESYYRRTLPLRRIETELEAPTPTHFVVKMGELETEFSITYWDQDLTIASTVSHAQTATIRFIKKTVTSTLNLSIAAAVLKAI